MQKAQGKLTKMLQLLYVHLMMGYTYPSTDHNIDTIVLLNLAYL